MITIEGLNARQRQIMDLLWECQNMDAITALIEALPTVKDKQDARSLVLIATWESLEQELGFSKEDINAAERCIARAMR